MPEKFIEAHVDTSQFNALQDALLRKPKADAKRIVRDGLELGSLAFKQAIMQEAPKRTGFMASHFNVKFSFRGSTDGTSGAAFVGPDGRMDYPNRSGGYRKKGSRKVGRIPVISVVRFIEFGTSKMSANAFFTRAFESAKETALYRVIAAIKQGLGL